MIRKSVIFLVCILAADFQLMAAQDFEHSYTLSPGRNISIDNKMGDVKVTGYDGKDIKVSAFTKGPDKDSIKIVDKSFGPQIILFPVSSKFRSSETRVDFEVKIPNSAKFVFLKLKSGSGNIEVSDFSGRLTAESLRGNVKVVNVNGFVDARSISGDMDAEIKQSQGRNQMRFLSMSGDVKVTAPTDFEALIKMKSASGDLKTDFPIDIRKRRYGEHSAGGKLGSGTQILTISSVSGNVSLLKK
ncbi:MAG: DUF4097 family beta strand repeat-containing protein [Acidobacteriota bacterium]|jgi:hypothetical protein